VGAWSAHESSRILIDDQGGEADRPMIATLSPLLERRDLLIRWRQLPSTKPTPSGG